MWNKYQTQYEDLNLDLQPEEVKEQFLEAVNNIPFVKSLISADRPRAKDLKRDSEGKIIIDVTLPHILEDMDYFRPSAIFFLLNGCYTKLRPNPNPNSEYYKWAKEEIRRCFEGYIRPSDGEWITGDMYFFLNYCPIQLIKKDKTGKDIRTVDFPKAWEGHYYKFHYLNLCRLNGKHAAELSRRGSGKSFTAAALLAKRFILGESYEVCKKVQCVVTASEKKYLHGANQVLDMFQYYIDFCAMNTLFPNKTITSSLPNMLWIMGYKDKETGVRKGSENSVVGITSKDDESKLRGSRGVLYLLEESGTFPRLLNLYQVLLPSVLDGSSVWGLIFLYGTSGDNESDFSSMQELMYNPRGYSINPLPNVFDKEGLGRREFTFFFPGYINRANCYDKDGNSDVTKALLEIYNERYVVKYNSTNINAITKKISEIPITPQEAILRTRGNMFPVTLLNERLNELDNNPSEFDDVYVGDLAMSKSGKISWIATNDKPLREFPLKDNKANGAIEIFKMPEKDKEGNVFNHRYIAGVDPIDDDASGTVSLVSCFILDLWTDKIVCEWTGRLDYADDCYERIRLMLLFYNARCLYEAHPYSLIVHTPNGTKLWKDIKVGDLLFSPTKDVVRVTDIPIDEEMDIYKVTLSDGRTVEASNNHIWNVYKGTSKKVINVTTEQLLKDGLLNKHKLHKYFIPEHKGVEYKHKQLPIDPYTMGIILSEGSIRGSHCTKNNIQISSSFEDMEFYKTTIPYNIKHIGNKGFSWHISITDCKKIMNIYGLYNTDSHTKFIPEDYMLSSRTQRLELLKGLMDGDGCANNKGVSIFVTCSENLAKNIMSLGRSLGVKCWLQKARKGVYRVALASTLKIFKLPRKVEKLYVYKPYTKGSKASAILYKTAISNIEYSHKERGKCVTVDSEDGLYLIGDYITTHNCNKKGMFAYFSRMSCLYLLADCPEYLRDKDLVKGTLYGNKLKGVNATLPINNYANELIKNWLIKPVTTTIKEGDEEKQIEVFNLFFIRNRALLKELILFNPDINVDRIRALGMCMLLREERMIMYQGDVKSNMLKKQKTLATDPFFMQDIKKDDNLIEYRPHTAEIDFSNINVFKQ